MKPSHIASLLMLIFALVSPAAAHCLPMGLMQFHIHPQPRRMIQTPDLMVILYEGNAGIRQIFLDGRPLPKNGDAQPWWYGYSTGHWDAGTLVVVTNNFRDDGWL